MASAFSWRICQCCGKQAGQHIIKTTKHGMIYPDLCQGCVDSIKADHPTGDLFFAEMKRREKQFEQTFEVVGFRPIIRRR